MKNKLLTKVIAVTAIASMSVIGSINIANADVFGLPYVNSYDGVDTEKYEGVSFWDNNGNKLGIWQYYDPGNSNVLELTTDPDAPERGGVMKVTVNSPVAGAFARYKHSNVTSGKILLKYDIKAQNPLVKIDFVQETSAGAGYLRFMSLCNNKVLYNEDNPTYKQESTYKLNEYNTVKHIVDLDANTITTYFKDMVVTGPSQDTTEAFRIQYQSYSSTETPNDVFYIDNLEMRAISGSVAPVLKDAEGKKVTAYAKVSDALTLSLDGGDSFDKAPKATLVDLGANAVSVTKREIPVTAELVNGVVTYYLDEELTAGNRYKLTIEDVETSWAQSLTKNEFEFVCSETGGNYETIYVEDFSSAESINPAVGAGSVFGDSKLVYFTTGGSYEILNDTSYAGGKALKMNAGAVMGYRVADAANGGLKYGEIEMEAKLIPSGWGNYMLGNDSVANNRMFQWGTTYSLNYYQSPAEYGNLTWSDTINYEGEIVVKHNFRLEDGTFDANINGVDKLNRRMNLIDNGGASLMNNGVVFVKLSADTESTIVDYLKFKHSIMMPTVTKITFVKADGTETQYIDGTKIADVKAMKVYFNESVVENNLSRIKVTAYNENVAYTGSYDSENLVYTMNFESDLLPGTTYNVLIDEGVVSSVERKVGSREKIEGSFVTDGVALPSSVKMTDAEGNTLESLANAGNTVKIVAENVVSEDGKVVIVYAGYNGGKLMEMSFDEVEVSGRKATYEATIQNKAGLTSVRAFVLEDFKTAKPLCVFDEI